MRSRLESPAAPGALFGSPAPSEAELAAVKHQMDCTLGCIPEDDLPPVPTCLPPDSAAAAALRASQLAGGGSGTTSGTATANFSSTATAKRGSVVGAKAAGTTGGGVAAGAKGATVGKGGTLRSSAVGGALVGGEVGWEVDGGDFEPEPVDWRSLQTWVRLEGLLDVQVGGEVVDGPLTAYLAQMLNCQKQQQRP